MMTREAYLQLAIENCIGCTEETDIYFVEPLWMDILEAAVGDEEPADVDQKEVFHILDLAVKKANARNDRTKIVMNWLYDTITQTVDPSLLQEENEMVKNMTEYMQLNDQLKNREAALAKEERAVGQKKDISEMLPGMRFNKK